MKEKTLYKIEMAIMIIVIVLLAIATVLGIVMAIMNEVAPEGTTETLNRVTQIMNSIH